MVTTGRIKVTRTKLSWPEFVQKYRFHPDVVSICHWDNGKIISFRPNLDVNLEGWANRFRQEVNADCFILNGTVVQSGKDSVPFITPPDWRSRAT